jgi:hypothetical protein
MRAVLPIVFALSALTLFAQTPTPAPKKAKPAAAPAAAAPAPVAAAKPAPAPVATGFVGNKDSKVFHTTACKIGAKMKPANKVVFASKEEAVKAGYTPCKVCIKP